MSHDNYPAVQDPDYGQPVANPGIEEHIERYTDANPAAANRAYGAIVGMLAAVPVLAILFVVIYFAVPRNTFIEFGPIYANAQNVGFGLTGGIAVLLIGLACVQWARVIMTDAESVEYRHSAGSPPEARAEVAQQFSDGVEQSRFGRRKLIGGALAGALGFSVVPVVVLFADLGPWPTKARLEETLEKTIWAEGVPVVNDVTFQKIKPEDVEIGQLINAQPETLLDYEGSQQAIEKAKCSLIVVRMDPASIKIPESRQDWQVAGILAYSKICTHVGCPISLWERQTHNLLCPCHQSMFDLSDSGVVVFGPAARSLPQLPIKVNSEGYLVAQSDFTVPVGPSYFERNAPDSYPDGDA